MDKYRIDSTKLMFHPERVAQWRAADTWEKAKSLYPIYVEIAPVGACNHRCTFCACDFVGYRSIVLDHNILVGRLHEMAECGVKSIMFAGEGEPLLHKDINPIVIWAIEYELPLDVSFTTNGVLLNRLEVLGLCSWVKVSLNAGQRSTYAQIHRTKEKDWDTVWANLKDATKRKGGCTLGVQSVLLPENRAEMFMLAHMVRDAGCDYFVVKPYSQHKKSITHQYEGVNYNDDNGLEEALATLNSDTFQVVFRSEAMRQEAEEIHYEKCNATPNFWAYIMASGDVYSCSAFLLDDRFRLGNVNQQSFAEIWSGSRREENWRYVRETLDIRECRKNCRMDRANRYLADFGKVQHVNFI